MKSETEFEEEAVDDVPVSPVLSPERKNRYGSIPDLPDEELADPEELLRLAWIKDYEPVLLLPVKTRRGWIKPNIDEYFGVDYGAFDSMDFARTQPEFDKARYKAEKLKEELQSELMMLEMLSERLPEAKYKALEYVQKDWLEIDDIASEDLRAFVKYSLRVERIRRELRDLRERNKARREKRLAAWLK